MSSFRLLKQTDFDNTMANQQKKLISYTVYVVDAVSPPLPVQFV